MSKRKVWVSIYMRMQGKWTGNSQRGYWAAGLLLIVMMVAAVAGRAEAAASNDDESAAQELFKLTNQEREKAGLAKLQWDDRLAQAARQHAQLIVQHGELSHQFAGEPSVRDRIAATNLHFDRSGENVAFDDNAEDAHEGLMNSPPHRANILNSGYNTIGIAAVQKGDLLYVVEDFAGRLPDYSSNKVEEIIAGEVQQERTQHELKPLTRVADPELRDQACAMAQQDQLITRGLRTVKRTRYTVSYTATDPVKLPSEAMRPLGDPKAKGFSVGACFAKSASHPNALYWVALTFY